MIGPATRALLRATDDRFRAAPIVETLGEYRDTFDRAHSRVSVELCHGTWCTFARQYAFTSTSHWRQHESREKARAFARDWLSPAWAKQEACSNART